MQALRIRKEDLSHECWHPGDCCWVLRGAPINTAGPMHPCGEEPGMGKCGAACHSHVIAQGGLRAAWGFSGLTALLAFKSNKGAGAKSRPEELLLCLKLLVDKLLQRHRVHRVLQGQLWDREEPHCVKEAKHVPLPCDYKALSSPPQQHNCFCLPSYKGFSNSPTVEKFAGDFIQSVHPQFPRASEPKLSDEPNFSTAQDQVLLGQLREALRTDKRRHCPLLRCQATDIHMYASGSLDRSWMKKGKIRSLDSEFYTIPSLSNNVHPYHAPTLSLAISTGSPSPPEAHETPYPGPHSITWDIPHFLLTPVKASALYHSSPQGQSNIKHLYSNARRKLGVHSQLSQKLLGRSRAQLGWSLSSGVQGKEGSAHMWKTLTYFVVLPDMRMKKENPDHYPVGTTALVWTMTLHRDQKRRMHHPMQPQWAPYALLIWHPVPVSLHPDSSSTKPTPQPPG
ncbi:hypothetical protein GH733_009748 [Mirounga leonina]|nr:hypothetical protein GH733_009748 [Mirounga leonina]